MGLHGRVHTNDSRKKNNEKCYLDQTRSIAVHTFAHYKSNSLPLKQTSRGLHMLELHEGKHMLLK